MVYKFTDSPDKSFFSKVISFLQCFYQLWLFMALCTLSDFYLNDVKNNLKREKEKKDNLNTQQFNQTLQIYINLEEKRKSQAFNFCSSQDNLTIASLFGWTEKSCDITLSIDSTLCKRKILHSNPTSQSQKFFT